MSAVLGWTLRFKHHKTTTLLHVDPLQSMISVKAELLRSLKDTHPNGQLSSGVAIPDTPSDIVLGKAKDVHDLTNGGWERVYTNDASLNEAKKKKVLPDDCPKGVGLKDGSVLAYKFKSEELDMEDEGLGLDDEDEKWDVVIASYDENAEGIPQLPPATE